MTNQLLGYYFQGFLLGIAYVAPIGTQNLYVINTALKHRKLTSYKVAFITFLFDISLGISCFFGIGVLIQRYYIIKRLFLLAGSIFVIYIGISLIRSKEKSKGTVNIFLSFSWFKAICSCFAVTWLNPQAIVDGSLLLGGFRAYLPYRMSNSFIFGVCSASFIWFMSLTTIILLFKNKLNAKIIYAINVVCGTIMIFYGMKLGYSFIMG